MVFSSLSLIKGHNLVFRLIRQDDAEYVNRLRTEVQFNRFLSVVKGSVNDQRHWIDAYKTREAEGRELYYMIERNDGVSCGLVRIYNIGSENFTW